MLKRFKRIGLALGLTAILFGLGSVSAQSAPPVQSVPIAVSVPPSSVFRAQVVNNDISQNTVHSTAYMVNGSTMRFYGTLQAKAFGGQNYCYQMQYKTPAGNWTTEGFFTSEQVTQLVSHCSSEVLRPYRTWSIHDGLDVRGIRFTNGVNTGTHCDTATNCRALTPP